MQQLVLADETSSDEGPAPSFDNCADCPEQEGGRPQQLRSSGKLALVLAARKEHHH